jgi:outer membrane protein assembly factor BamB
VLNVILYCFIFSIVVFSEETNVFSIEMCSLLIFVFYVSTGAAATRDGYIVVGSTDQKLYCINGRTGECVRT